MANDGKPGNAGAIETNLQHTLLASRRQFLQWASGVAAGAIAFPGLACAAPARLVRFADAGILLTFDSRMHSGVAYVQGDRTIALANRRASEFVQLSDGRRLEDFTLQHSSTEAVGGPHGAGTQLTLTGVAAAGLEKTVRVRLYDRYPGFALYRVSYRNVSDQTLGVSAWTNGAFVIHPGNTRAARFWCYSGSSYADRRDWVQPLGPGFAQDNFFGMTASDYGGGTPIVDVWRPDCGLAVGHLDSKPRLVWIPVKEQHGAARIDIHAEHKQSLRPGETFETLETFAVVHSGDHFATLDSYRRLMSERGLRAATPPAASYEPIWCAWGYERDCSVGLIEGTLPKVKELGLSWAVIDDGWQSSVGDWKPHAQKFPAGEPDMKRLVERIKAQGLKPRLWWAPLAAAPGSDVLHDHTDMLLLDKDGAVQNISWWNSFYLCPAYEETVAYTLALVRKFVGEWGYAGLKIDGQHLNGVPPCFNPAHQHARPEESMEQLPELFRAIYATASGLDPSVVIELCPCGTSYAFYDFPYINQAPASDPESSWQVRLKGKSLKALMGRSAPFAGDHVELSDHGDDFASTVGIGAVVSTKFTWPRDPKPKDSFLLTPDKETEWRRWIALYNEKMLSLGTYRGELYDIGFDKPEAHVIEKSGHLYYSFYAARWNGTLQLRGLAAGSYRVRDYFNGHDLGIVSGSGPTPPAIHATFARFLLIEAVPV
jgi:alpha-galactosidase